MKKIKTINKLLSSLTLLSPLAGVGFNNQYQNTQKVITEDFKNSLNNFINSNAETQMGDIYVNLDGTGKIIQSYASGTGSLVVPDYITQIADKAFYSNQNITSLDLSNATSLTTIGKQNFYSCTKITGNIILPDSLITIGDYTFYQCSNLTGNLIIPSSVTSIGYSAFCDINITSLDLSNATSLTTITDYAFASCLNLTGDLVIPSNLTTIGNKSFLSGASFSNISIDEQNTHFSFATNLGTNNKVLISGSDGFWKDDSIAISGLSKFSNDITLPPEIKTIQENAFQYCDIKGKLIIGPNITSIGEAAFQGTNFTSLDLSNATGLQSIPKNVFCSDKLTGNIVIPKNIKKIGDSKNQGSIFNSKNINSLIINAEGITLNTLSLNYSYIKNIYFTFEQAPTFSGEWIHDYEFGKIYVPSEQAKQTYLSAPFFGFSEDKIEIGLPPESKSNIGLVLGLVLGLGIPIILAAGFGVWYLTKKRKTTVKI